MRRRVRLLPILALALLLLPATSFPASALAPDGNQTTMRRAVVLEPFATELALGPHAGDLDASVLQAAGFGVDQLYDSAVSVETMSTLHEYQVIDIDTHSGANTYGEGVLATGQQANDDPAVADLVKDFSVMTVSIDGSPLLYYGVMSRYFSLHAANFAPRTLFIATGCDLLRAQAFWGALHQRGVGAMVSWDDVVSPHKAQVSTQLLLESMQEGMTLDQAMAVIRQAGYGTDQRDGKVSHMGYLGDGSLTLDQVGVPPTPIPSTPTALPSPSPTPVPPIPTSTPLPTPVPTARPSPEGPPGNLMRPLRLSTSQGQ